MKLNKTLNIIFGSFLLGIGVVLANLSNFGADAMSYFWLGTSIKLNTTIGRANIIISCILLVIPLCFDRRQINIGTILSPIVIGLTLDLINPLLPAVTRMDVKVVLFLFSILFYTLGVAIYVFQDYGRSTYDATIVILNEKTAINYTLSKTLTDGFFYIGAILLGAPVQIGPLIYVLVSGVCIHYFMSQLRKKQERV